MNAEGSIQSLQNLDAALLRYLKDFNQYDFAFIVGNKDWSFGPLTLRERIANELWFRIWENSKKQLFPSSDPMVQMLFKNTATRNVTWRLHAEYGDEEILDPALVVLRALSVIVEYSVLQNISSMIIPVWDRDRNVLKIECSERLRILDQEIVKSLNDQVLSEIFSALIRSAGAASDSILPRVIEVLAEEEKLRHELRNILNSTARREKGDDFYMSIGEQSVPSLINITSLGEALLRPCVELLLDTTIDIASGLQYEAAAILGRLQDSRSMTAIIKCLEIYGPEYTNLRCNLIYALGNIISAQVWEAVQKDIRNLEDQFRTGQFDALRGWLTENIYQYGHKYDPQDHVQRVTGSRIDSAAYVRYLTKKYSDISGL